MNITVKEFKERVIEELRIIERLPSAEDGDLIDIKNCCYPLNRGISSYFKKLPKLESSLKKCMKILDIGAGNGIALSEIAEIFPGGEYVGTGIQAGNIKSDTVIYKTAFASDLPFEDGYFDIVISVHGLSWEIEQQKSIEEIYRVLNPQGKAFLFFTSFEYSVDHKLGEAFWDDIKFNKDECKNYGVNTDILHDTMKAVIKKIPMKHPYKEHKDLFYIELDKRFATTPI